MKISMDPMTTLRAAAVAKVNTYFANLENGATHIERVYARKRQVALAVMNGAELAEDHPFSSEAALRGLPPVEFARDIIGKPDVSTVADQRELERQKLLLEIKAAATPSDINLCLNKLTVGL